MSKKTGIEAYGRHAKDSCQRTDGRCVITDIRGVAIYEDSMELEQFIESAEQKLHLAKYNGGNQVVR